MKMVNPCTLRLRRNSFMCRCVLSKCLTSSQVSHIGYSVNILVHIRGHLCSSRWGWRHLGTVLCEQLQSLQLISTQLWKTRWVLLALSASLALSVSLQTGSQSLLPIQLCACILLSFVFRSYIFVHTSSVDMVVLDVSNVAAPQRCLPPGQGRLTESDKPNQLSFWGGNGVCIIWVNDTTYPLTVFLLPPLLFSALSASAAW